MILSRTQLEDIADTIVQDFNKFFYVGDRHRNMFFPQPMPIDQFATEYLKLHIIFDHLSSDGSVCGLTSYADTEYLIHDGKETRILALKQNDVLLDRSFVDPRKIHALCGKRRFTLAHECAHQILYQMESDEQKLAHRRKYSARSSYSIRELKTREDWNEWQANVLGAAILMPRSEIERVMHNFYLRGSKIKRYSGEYIDSDYFFLTLLCRIFGVSLPALEIRLHDLGYMENIPAVPRKEALEVGA